jgi:hypothetical protein
MKKINLILLWLAFLIQFSFLSKFAWDFQIPNLILITVVIIGVRKNLAENLGWFLLAGFIFEIFSVEFFGFNLILFVGVGGAIWFLRNIILNRENNILVEIFFWGIVKIIWDLFYKIELFLKELFQGNWQIEIWTTFSKNYFKEIIAFVLVAVLIAVVSNYFRKYKEKL